jgi:hypothetical protein
MMKKRIFTLLVAFVFLLPASSALATMVDFRIPDGSQASGGSIEYQDGATGLVASNILIDQVTLNPGNKSIEIEDGTLSFQTGPIGSYDATTMSWSFQGGGYLTITGDLVGDGEGSMTLMTGSWNSANVVSYGGGALGIFLGDYTDTKNAWMLYQLGLIDDPGDITTFAGPYDGIIHLSFTFDTTTFDEEHGFFNSDLILSGEVDNTYVPIPAAVWLLGSGFIGLIGIRRKIKK